MTQLELYHIHMRLHWILATAIACFFVAPVHRVYAQTLDPHLHHLRHGLDREWDDFPADAEGQTTRITFQSRTNDTEETLRLRHRDLRLTWDVLLNGKRLATLPQEENAMVTLLAIPPHALREGENDIQIVCTSPAPDADDILVGGVELLHRPVKDLTSESTVEVTVTDADTHHATPCRLTVVNPDNDLVPLGVESSETLAVRTGVVYTATGRATLRLPAGHYTLYANRGFEWSLATKELDPHRGANDPINLSIRREVDTTGYVAADAHIHTFTYSHHGDATLAERMITLAGEGIELPIATDHNLTIDYEDAAKSANVRQFFAPVIGDEVTTAKLGHFNVFPLEKTAKLIDFRAPTWERLFADITDKAPNAVVILNHARDDHGGFRPFDPRRHLALTGEDTDGQTLRANAMEVFNSGATLNDPLLLYRDWMGCLNRGLRLTPIGASDSHDVSRFIVGQGRTYVRVDDADPAHVNIANAVNAIKQGRVLVSYGLLADLKVNNQFHPADLAQVTADTVTVEVTVAGPAWTRATNVALYANGQKIQEFPIDNDHAARPGIKSRITWQLPKPTHDCYLTAVATGPGLTAPYWPGARPFQRTSPHWQPYTFACTAPVFLDADSSGTFDSAFDYATRIVEKSDAKLDAVLSDLAPYDAAVAAQAASILHAHGTLDTPQSIDAAANRAAAPATREGLAAFAKAWREHEAAVAKPAPK